MQQETKLGRAKTREGGQGEGGSSTACDPGRPVPIRVRDHAAVRASACRVRAVSFAGMSLLTLSGSQFVGCMQTQCRPCAAMRSPYLYMA